MWKKMILIGVIVAMCTILANCYFSKHPGSSSSVYNRNDQVYKEISKLPKIDPSLRHKLWHLNQESKLHEEIHALVELKTDTLTDSQKEILEKNGVKITSAIGPILTVTFVAKTILVWGKLDFISYIQASKRMKPL